MCNVEKNGFIDKDI